MDCKLFVSRKTRYFVLGYSGSESRRKDKTPWGDSIPFLGTTAHTIAASRIWKWIKRPNQTFCDIIDRINCSYVPTILMFFALMICTDTFGFSYTEPIRCLRSHDLNEQEYDYSVEVCRTKNVYYVPTNESLPRSSHTRRSTELGYYHWVPLTLILQAILFYLPNWIWSHLNRSNGANFGQIIQSAKKLGGETRDDQDQQQKTSKLAYVMYKTIIESTPPGQRGFRFGRTCGAFVLTLYIFVKCLYLGNVAMQFFCLNFFLGRSYRLWGYGVLKALVNGENWQDSPAFPRLAYCDVHIRRLGDTERHTLQCHLRINALNEKIYFAIWCLLLGVFMATLLNLLYYIIVIFLVPRNRERTVRRCLNREKELWKIGKSTGEERIERFATSRLRYDGVLLFWFIEIHAGPINAGRLMTRLFLAYLKENEEVPTIKVQLGGENNKLKIIPMGENGGQNHPGNPPAEMGQTTGVHSTMELKVASPMKMDVRKKYHNSSKSQQIPSSEMDSAEQQPQILKELRVKFLWEEQQQQQQLQQAPQQQQSEEGQTLGLGGGLVVVGQQQQHIPLPLEGGNAVVPVLGPDPDTVVQCSADPTTVPEIVLSHAPEAVESSAEIQSMPSLYPSSPLALSLVPSMNKDRDNKKDKKKNKKHQQKQNGGNLVQLMNNNLNLSSNNNNKQLYPPIPATMMNGGGGMNLLMTIVPQITTQNWTENAGNGIVLEIEE